MLNGASGKDANADPNSPAMALASAQLENPSDSGPTKAYRAALSRHIDGCVRRAGGHGQAVDGNCEFDVFNSSVGAQGGFFFFNGSRSTGDVAIASTELLETVAGSGAFNGHLEVAAFQRFRPIRRP